jgi:hypothetical protein
VLVHRFELQHLVKNLVELMKLDCFLVVAKCCLHLLDLVMLYYFLVVVKCCLHLLNLVMLYYFHVMIEVEFANIL